MKKQKSRRRSSFSVDADEECEESESLDDAVARPKAMAAMVGGPGGGGYGGGGRSGAAPSAPPPPPAAKPAVAQVESGGGSIGAVSFVVGKPAVIK